MKGKRKCQYHEVFALLRVYFFDQYVPDSEKVIGRCIWHNVKGFLNQGKKIIEEELAKIERQEAKNNEG